MIEQDNIWGKPGMIFGFRKSIAKSGPFWNRQEVHVLKFDNSAEQVIVRLILSNAEKTPVDQGPLNNETAKNLKIGHAEIKGEQEIIEALAKALGDQG